ncbi:MAG: glycosyltransferase [Candidatus Omnitrophota bacterium]
MKKRVLIFYISRNSGHYYAASAIEKGLFAVGNNLQVEKINALDYTNPILGRVLNKTYLEVIKKKPEMWGNIYDNPEVLEKTKKARENIFKYNMSRMKKLIEYHDPHIILCTQAFPCGMAACYKKKYAAKISLIGVLTDYAPHSYWLFDEVDYYVVPSEDAGNVLVAKGVPIEKTKVYGIPVDPKFCLQHDKALIKKKFKLEETEPIVLVMGGSQGLGQMEGIVDTLLAQKNRGYQVLVVTGTNKKLYRRLKKQRGQKGIYVLPYTEYIDQLMEIADVIVTKAGGLTVAETLVKGLPMIIVNPIPGHERMNADYLIAKGAAVEVKHYSNICQRLEDLFSSREKLEQMKNNIGKLANPESALNIARLALASFEKYNS